MIFISPGRKISFLITILSISYFAVSCSGTEAGPSNKRGEMPEEKGLKAESAKNPDAHANKIPAGAAVIMARKQVPVLCYHHIREPKPGQANVPEIFSVTPEHFAEQMKALYDSGYQTILPDQLYSYLVYGDPLPPKPVIISFDDTDEEQFTIGWNIMKKYGFRGVFFIMTVAINKPHYMTVDQIKELSEAGNAVESHTWNHKDVRKYEESDYLKQLVDPRKTIEDITGRTAAYFAYPFGAWNESGITFLKKAGFKMAFTLAAGRDPENPLYTVRRMMVPSDWTAKGMMGAVKKTFERD